MGLKELWATLRSNRDLPTINMLIGLVKAIAALLIFVGLTVGGWGLWHSKMALALGSGTLAVGIAVGAMLIVDRRRRYKRVRKTNPGLRSIGIDYHAEVISDQLINYHFNFEMLVIEDHVDSYNTNLTWTGRGKMDVRCEGLGCLCHVFDSDSSDESFLKIIFPRIKMKGEKFTLSYVIETNATEQPAKQFISETVGLFSEVPEKIILSAKFLNAHLVERVWVEESLANRGRAAIIEHGDLKLNTSNSARYEFSRIKNGHRYLLKWKTRK
jgi:hypothetical protein